MSVFSHAGVSRLNGEFKVRFANDALRVKVLAKNGHKDIDIIELKEPMTKEDAIAYLMSIDFATQNGVTNAQVQAALEEAVEKRAPKAANRDKPKKEAKKPKKVPAKATPSMESIKAKVAAKTAPVGTLSKAEITAQMEDAPF
ncbi:MAG: hypothetical protein EBY81_08725 [Verrucomicrobia bacterium]|nr:hypothetical protein [Verrucomicrobiota bacterium]NDI17978.1 hypothetical protein [Verrucomicrobiota bacterium]